MNAKELRQAAEFLRAEANHSVETIGPDRSWLQTRRDDVRLACAEHILSTVRDDDDEPVSEEWLEISCERKTARTFAVKSLEVFTRTKDVWLCNPAAGEKYASIKTRGQFRSLCRGLGVELKEVGRVD